MKETYSLCRNRLNIICYRKEEDKNKIIQQIIDEMPNYKVDINKNFFPKKVGPFQLKEKSMFYHVSKVTSDYCIMHSDDDLRALNIYHLRHELPSSLNNIDLLKFSLLLDLYQKRKYVLLDGQDFNYDLHQTQNIIRWIMSFIENSNGTLIWLTHYNLYEASGLYNYCHIYSTYSSELRLEYERKLNGPTYAQKKLMDETDQKIEEQKDYMSQNINKENSEYQLYDCDRFSISIPSSCSNCGECVRACPTLALGQNDKPCLDFELCVGCQYCAQVCLSQLIRVELK